MLEIEGIKFSVNPGLQNSNFEIEIHDLQSFFWIIASTQPSAGLALTNAFKIWRIRTDQHFQNLKDLD